MNYSVSLVYSEVVQQIIINKVLALFFFYLIQIC